MTIFSETDVICSMEHLETLLLLSPPALVAKSRDTLDTTLALINKFCSEHVIGVVGQLQGGRTVERVQRASCNWLISLLERLSCEKGSCDGHTDPDLSSDLDADSECLSCVPERQIDAVTRTIANLSGRAGCGALVRKYSFDTCFPSIPRISVVLREPEFADADIGALSWGSGILMSELLCQNYISLRKSPILEIGCGTGAAGLTSAKLWPSNKVHMTDYHEKVLENLVLSRDLNLLSEKTVLISQFDWRWVSPSPPSITLLPPFKPLQTSQKFPIILAADCIFDLSHSHLVPKVFDTFLEPEGLVFCIVPHRTGFEAEISTFLSNLENGGVFEVCQESMVREGHQWPYSVLKITRISGVVEIDRDLQ